MWIKKHKKITRWIEFLELPPDAQLLYNYFRVNANDKGITPSRPIMKLFGIDKEYYQILLDNGFIKELNDDKVVKIKK